MGNRKNRFEALVNALSTDMYRYAYWLCRNTAMAEDLVQETFMRAWRALESLQDEKAARAWLITILRREHARQYERYSPDIVDIEAMAIADHSATPGQHMEHQLLQRAVGGLAQEFREPLVLQVMYGFSIEEIANTLDLNKNTVLTRLHRARHKLKALIDDPQPQRGSINE